MKYQADERIYIVNKLTQNNSYCNLQDSDSGVKFKLPIHVIENFRYVFSWDRYLEERDNVSYKQSIQNELERLQKLTASPNILKGIEDMKRFLEELDN